MKACKDLCPVLKIQRCCFLCDKRETCNEACAEDSNDLCERWLIFPMGIVNSKQNRCFRSLKR